MFTGIVEAVGRIEEVESLGGGVRIAISAPFAGELRVDESVSVSGVCQTVVGRDERRFQVEAIEETLAKTNLGSLVPGSRVNLERAMRLGGRIDGHLVQGHVDATALVTRVEALETSHLYTVQFDPAFRSFVIPVGSICLDGISLTVARLDEDTLTVAIIPHTYGHTIVSDWAEGTRVNVEFDMVGKYVVGHLDRAKSRA